MKQHAGSTQKCKSLQHRSLQFQFSRFWNSLSAAHPLKRRETLHFGTITFNCHTVDIDFPSPPGLPPDNTKGASSCSSSSKSKSNIHIQPALLVQSAATQPAAAVPTYPKSPLITRDEKVLNRPCLESTTPSHSTGTVTGRLAPSLLLAPLKYISSSTVETALRGIQLENRRKIHELAAFFILQFLKTQRK